MIGLEKIDIYFFMPSMSEKMLFGIHMNIASLVQKRLRYLSCRAIKQLENIPQSETTPNDPEKYAMSNFFHYQDSRQTGNQQLGYAKIGMQ